MTSTEGEVNEVEKRVKMLLDQRAWRRVAPLAESHEGPVNILLLGKPGKVKEAKMSR